VKSGKRSTAMGTSDRGGLLTAATQRSKWLAIAAGKFRVPEILSAACGHRFDCDGLMRPQACDGNHKPWSRNFQVTNKPGQHRTAVLPIVLEIVPKKSGCRLPSSQAARSLDARPRVSRRQRLRCLVCSANSCSSQSGWSRCCRSSPPRSSSLVANGALDLGLPDILFTPSLESLPEGGRVSDPQIDKNQPHGRLKTPWDQIHFRGFWALP